MNRTFLIKMSKPCDLENFLQPNQVDWRPQIPAASGKGARRKLTEHVFSVVWNYDFISQLEKIKTSGLFSFDQDLLRIKAAIMFSDAFSRNQEFHERLRSLGYDPGEFFIRKRFFKWYKELFKLEATLQVKYEKLLAQAKPSHDTKLICTQIRIGQKTANRNADYFFMRREETKNFWHLIASEIIQKNNWAADKYRLFVTSDYEDVKEEAVKVFGPASVVYNRDSSVHVELDNTCKNFDNVILDFHMLQNCDYVVASHSGFGILGACNRPNPNTNFYVYSQPNQTVLQENVWNRQHLEFLKVEDVVNDLYFI